MPSYEFIVMSIHIIILAIRTHFQYHSHICKNVGRRGHVFGKKGDPHFGRHQADSDKDKLKN